MDRKEITQLRKTVLFKSIWRLILTFGCVSWVLTERKKTMIQAILMEYLRRVRGVTKMDKLRDKKQIRDSISKYIERRHNSWWVTYNNKKT